MPQRWTRLHRAGRGPKKGEESVKSAPHNILLIFNARSGKHSTRKLNKAHQTLERAGYSVLLHDVSEHSHEAIIASLQHAERIVLAGGDGTIRETLKHFETLRQPVSIYPFGTANVLALELRAHRSCSSLLTHLRSHPPLKLKPVNVNGTDKFFALASVGFDAKVVQHVNPRLKRLLGKVAYIWSAIRCLWNFNPRIIEISIDGREYQSQAAWFLNGRYYAGKYQCVPKPSFSEDTFACLLFTIRNRRDIVRYAIALARSRIGTTAGVQVVPAERVHVVTKGTPIQLDGDFFGLGPATFEKNQVVYLFTAPNFESPAIEQKVY